MFIDPWNLDVVNLYLNENYLSVTTVCRYRTNEIDFLILKNKQPFLPIEVKLADAQPAASWKKFMRYLNCAYAIQIVMKPDIYKIYDYPNYRLLTISAAHFLQYLV